MKKRIIVLGSVVVAVIALWSAAWLVLAGMIKTNVDALAAADGVTSPRLACATLNVGGYPFRFDLDCTGARIDMADLGIDVPSLRASVRVYAPTHLLAFAHGPLQLTDSFTGTSNSVAWSALEGSVRLDNWRIARLSISGEDVVWSDTLFANALIAQFPLAEIHLFDMPERHDPENRLAALAGYLRAEGATWPGLTLTDTNAEVQLEVSGLPDDVREWGDPMLLPRIQAAGGTLNIVAIHGTDASSTLDATGALQLDANGFPQGQITIASQGVAERIGPLLTEPARTLVLGAASADGTYNNQLNFAGGTMSSGLIPIATLVPLF